MIVPGWENISHNLYGWHFLWSDTIQNRIQNNFDELNPSIRPKKCWPRAFSSWHQIFEAGKEFLKNGLFLYRIFFLPYSYEAKVKNKNFVFPREENFLFSLFCFTKDKKNWSAEKSDPLYRNWMFLEYMNLPHIISKKFCYSNHLAVSFHSWSSL